MLVCLGACATEVDGFPPTFVGVGLELRIEGAHPVVVNVIAGGPADTAGILAGDRIVSVDSRETRDQTLGEVVMRLRGEPDTQVSLGIERGMEKVLVVVRRRSMAKAQTGYKPQ